MVNNSERRAPKKIPPTLEGPHSSFHSVFFPTSSNLVLCFLAKNRYKCPFSWLNHHLIFTKLRCLRLSRLNLHRDLRKIPGLPMDSATCHHDSPFMVVEWYNPLLWWYNPLWYNSPLLLLLLTTYYLLLTTYYLLLTTTTTYYLLLLTTYYYLLLTTTYYLLLLTTTYYYLLLLTTYLLLLLTSTY